MAIKSQVGLMERVGPFSRKKGRKECKVGYLGFPFLVKRERKEGKGRLKCLALDIGEVEQEGWSFSGLKRKGLIFLFFSFPFR